MSLTFDRFRAEMEQQNPDTDQTSDDYDQEVIDLAEATERMVKRKVNPMSAESQQKVMGLLKKCTSDVFNCSNDKEALIVSLEMSSNSPSKNQSRLTAHTKRLAAGQGNKTQMTITAVIEQSTANDMHQQMKVTKEKVSSVSNGGVSAQQNEPNEAEADKKSDRNVEVVPKTNDCSSNKRIQGEVFSI